MATAWVLIPIGFTWRYQNSYIYMGHLYVYIWVIIVTGVCGVNVLCLDTKKIYDDYLDRI